MTPEEKEAMFAARYAQELQAEKEAAFAARYAAEQVAGQPSQEPQSYKEPPPMSERMQPEPMSWTEQKLARLPNWLLNGHRQMEGVYTGMGDPIVGLAQLGANIRGVGDTPNWLASKIKGRPTSVNDLVKEREKTYQADRNNSDEFDWWRLGGNIASPVSVAAGAAAPQLSLLGRVGQGATIGAAYGATEPVLGDDYVSDKAWQIGTGAAAAGGLPIVGAGARWLGRSVPNTLGATTGTSAETVRAAYNAGKEGESSFVENMRGKVPYEEVVDTAKSGIGRMRESMYDAYATAKNGWGNDKTPLDFTGVGDAYNKAVAKFSFKDTPQPGVVGVKDKIETELNRWLQKAQADPDYLTAGGLDALKRHIATILPDDVANREGRSFVTSVVNGIKDTIIKQRPEYKDAMQNYWRQSSKLDEIEKTLSLGSKASSDTALRKLQSLMRNNAQSNYGNRLNLASELEQQGGVNLMAPIAGQAMGSWMPRGMTGAIQKAGVPLAAGAGFFNPALWGGLLAVPAAMPRVVGEAAYGLGRGVTAAKPITSPLRRVAPLLATLSNPNSQLDEAP